MSECYKIPLKVLGQDPKVLREQWGAAPDVEKRIAAELEREPFVDYVDVIDVILRNTPPNGFDETELRKSNVLIQMFANAKRVSQQTVILEAALYSYLCSRVKAFRWRIIHPHLVEFCDDIRDAERVQISEGENAHVPH